mmetsp:Transcript_11237/g.19189  ORF Transcript_11237/g.19189 Transcript_11237/m.19189 type:complete len:203 (+) Transcript_11237:560-1168(+)
MRYQSNNILSVLQRVIDSFQHDIFKEHLFLNVGAKVRVSPGQCLLHRLHQIFQWVLAVNRHDPVSHFVVACVERNSQIGFGFFQQALDEGNIARSRHGDLVVTKLHTLAIHPDIHRLDYVVRVGAGFAHTHNDNIRNAPSRLHVQSLRNHCLVHNFAQFQITYQAHLCSKAKLAIHATSKLRRDTKRPSIVIARNQHRLDNT